MGAWLRVWGWREGKVGKGIELGVSCIYMNFLRASKAV